MKGFALTRFKTEAQENSEMANSHPRGQTRRSNALSHGTFMEKINDQNKKNSPSNTATVTQVLFIS